MRNAKCEMRNSLGNFENAERKAVRQVQQPGNAIATVIQNVGTQESLLHFANRVQHRQPVKPCRRIGRTSPLPAPYNLLH